MADDLHISRTDESICIRNAAPSWPSGIAIVAFYCVFAGVAAWSWWELAPQSRSEQFVWTAIPVAAFGLLMLWFALFAVSHQQVVCEPRGVYYSRRVGPLPIWSRHVNFSDITGVRSGFRESASDQPDIYWLEFTTKSKPVRLKTSSAVEQLAQEISRRIRVARAARV